MKGDQEVIKHLNKIINELTAINHSVHSKMLKNWGLAKLGKHEFKDP